MHKTAQRNILALILIFLLALPALACNQPAREPREEVATLIKYQVETLEAQAESAPTAVPVDLSPSATPVPPTPRVLPSQIILPTQAPEQTIITSPTPVETESSDNLPVDFFAYTVQPGDTLPALAAHFSVPVESIRSDLPLDQYRLLSPGQVVLIPNTLGSLPLREPLLPDSLVVYSASAAQFDVQSYINQAGGFLQNYSEALDDGRLSGAQIVERVAIETSLDPRLLLAFLEFRSGWVTGQPRDPTALDYPLGFKVPGMEGLYPELALAARKLNTGYYGWRDGSLNTILFVDNSIERVSPGLNAGSVAVQNLMAKFYPPQDWAEALYGEANFLGRYQAMFGDPWALAAATGPLFPGAIEQPALVLPFIPGEEWSLTAGPHIAWSLGTPRGALDFAPVTIQAPCDPSPAWALAAGPGLVVRSGNGVVALDLDGDGNEGTGWVLVYMHIATSGRATLGTWLDQDGRIGHPSCEGGRSTGTHLHFSRKYNGEWISAEGPLSLTLSGWQAYAGEGPYVGYLQRGTEIVTANVNGAPTSIIVR